MHCTKIGAFKSSYKRIYCGVPQGSVISPLLFLIYINDIAKASLCHTTLFADDINLHMSNSCFNVLQTNVNLFQTNVNLFQTNVNLAVQTNVNLAVLQTNVNLAAVQTNVNLANVNLQTNVNLAVLHYHNHDGVIHACISTKCISAIQRILYTTAMYTSSFSFMYMCFFISLYCDAC